MAWEIRGLHHHSREEDINNVQMCSFDANASKEYADADFKCRGTKDIEHFAEVPRLESRSL